MKRVEAKVIVGANYGDEGKGMAASYFTQKATENGRRVLNILYNGGAQRGHTVEYKNGFRHVFHHFGSGLFDGAATYLDQDFILSPIIFNQEKKDLLHEVKDLPKSYSSRVIDGTKCFINGKCKVATPYDALINQIVEEYRSRNYSRHGSCGLGIWETRMRYRYSQFNLTFEELCRLSRNDLILYLDSIRKEYVKERLDYYHVPYQDIPFSQRCILESTVPLSKFEREFIKMTSNTFLWRGNCQDLARHYDSIIFEGAQGLAIDEDNIDYRPYVTASKTGSSVPIDRIKDISESIEVCYVTRSYFTRHGKGPFPTELPKEKINSEMTDMTNKVNAFQGEFRYGWFDENEFLERIDSDFEKNENYISKKSILVTHLNETNNDIFGNTRIKNLKQMANVYTSYSPFASEIN